MFFPNSLRASPKNEVDNLPFLFIKKELRLILICVQLMNNILTIDLFVLFFDHLIVQSNYYLNMLLDIWFNQIIKIFSMFIGRLVNKFSTLILAQHNGKVLSKNTLKMIKASSHLQQQTHLLLVGKNLNSVIDASKNLYDGPYVKKVITAELEHTLAENVENICTKLMEKYGYKYFLGLTSSYGRDVIPRLAGKYNSQPISDITQIIDPKTYIRPIYAGNALTKVVSDQDINFLTVRASSFEQPISGNNNPQIQNFDVSSLPQISTSFISQQKSESNRPQLTTARIVVSGGRGVKSKQNFDIINKLAQAFGDAAVGASRAAVDSGFCPNELQVGQTGKVVAPQLYIAVGISGAVQHLAGMKDSKVIVAINNRPDQPIFQIATYGLQADLFKALPQLTEKISKIRAG